MPELPEVEAMRRRLQRAAEGRVLTHFEAVDPRVLTAQDGAPDGLGTPVTAVERRAKYLTFQTGEAAWVLHFRMTGLLVNGPGQRHVRARWRFGDPVLSLEDPRCLGEVHRLRAADLPAWLDALDLGPEPWPTRRDGAWWAERLEGSQAPLKPALMDQRRIGGLGNIAASEICFRARLSPFRRASTLTPPEREALAEAAWRFLEEAVAEADREDLAYINAGGANPFQVYQRDGEPCPRCGATLERHVQSGRGTWLCARCQPGF